VFLYILYPVTPALSVETFHDKSICPADITLAIREPGTDGAVVSEGGGGGGLSPPPPPQEIDRSETNKRTEKRVPFRNSVFILIPSLESVTLNSPREVFNRALSSKASDSATEKFPGFLIALLLLL
jgi:hypothetical protein